MKLCSSDNHYTTAPVFTFLKDVPLLASFEDRHTYTHTQTHTHTYTHAYIQNIQTSLLNNYFCGDRKSNQPEGVTKTIKCIFFFVCHSIFIEFSVILFSLILTTEQKFHLETFKGLLNNCFSGNKKD